MTKIIVNKIKCNHCGDIIQSKHKNDCYVCSCGACRISGGLSELNRDFVYSPDDYTDLSVIKMIDDEMMGDDDTSGRKRNKRNKQRKGR